MRSVLYVGERMAEVEHGYLALMVERINRKARDPVTAESDLPAESGVGSSSAVRVTPLWSVTMPTKKNRAEYMRRYRARKKSGVRPETAPDTDARRSGGGFRQVVRESTLKRSTRSSEGGGAVHSSRTMAVDFIADALSHRESSPLSRAQECEDPPWWRRILLARLAGPLRYDGYRGGVASLSKEKAGELKMQMEQIAKASGLEGAIRFWRSPAPGRVTSSTGAVDILSADRSGWPCFSGFDDAICDEIGLFPANARGLVAGMRSSISARNGRFIALSVHGDSPFIPEIRGAAKRSSRRRSPLPGGGELRPR